MDASRSADRKKAGPGFRSVGGALARDAGPLFGVRVAGALANFVVLLLLVYRMPEGDVGLYYFLVNLWNILNVLIDFGGDPIATREIARHPHQERAILSDFLRAKAWLAGIGLAVFLIVVLSLIDDRAHRTSFLLTLFALPGFYLGSFSVMFRVRHQMGWPALALLIGQAVFFVGSVVGLFAFESGPGRFRGLALAFTAGALIGGVLIHQLARRRLPRLAGERSQRGARGFLRECWPQGVAALAGILYFYVDTLMLKALSGDAQAGYYNAAFRLLNFFIYAAGVISISVMPVLAREFARNQGRFRDVFRGTFTLLLLLAVPVGATGLALASELMTFLYRERMSTYGVAVPTLKVLLAAGVFTFGGALASTTLVAVKRQGLWTLVAVTGLGVNVGLNLWAIPRWGHLGAAWATLVTEGVVLALCLVVVRRIVGLRPDILAAGKILALGTLVFAVGTLVRPLPFLVAVGICLTVFGVGAAGLKLFPAALFRMTLWEGGGRPA